MHESRKVRVLQVITRLIIGGAQETVMLIAEMLDKNRYETEVISGPQTGPEGSLIEEVRRRGIKLIILPELVREIDLSKDLRAMWKLYRMISAGRYDIVHTNSSKAGILARWAAWLARVPIVVHTVHGWGQNEYQSAGIRRLFILLEKMSAAISAKLVVVSNRDVQKGLADGIATPDKYLTIRSGIELDRFMHPKATKAAMRSQLGIPKNALVVGTVTRLSPQKAPADFVAATTTLANEMPELHVVIVGDGPLRGEVEAMIRKAGVEKRFHLTGLRRDIPELLAAFDLFVLTSLWEGLPRVLPQAMAAGLPIVATAIDGNVEAVRDGDNGILVPAGDPQRISQAIKQLLGNRAMMAKLGAGGRERVVEFGAVKMVDEIDALYQKLLNEKEK